MKRRSELTYPTSHQKMLASIEAILCMEIKAVASCTFLVARDGDLLLGLGISRLVGSLDTELFSCGGEEGGADGLTRTAMSSVQVRRRLRRYSSVSRSNTSSLVSCSMALILCTTWEQTKHQRNNRNVQWEAWGWSWSWKQDFCNSLEDQLIEWNIQSNIYET